MGFPVYNKYAWYENKAKRGSLGWEEEEDSMGIEEKAWDI